MTAELVGPSVSQREEVNGYWFWGLVTLFIGVPELLAAFSKWMTAQIPWPTISNLVGKDLEQHHHWVALVVVGLIAAVTFHTLTYPTERKKAGRALRRKPTAVTEWNWGRRYIALVAVSGASAGGLAAAVGASKNERGYAIYLTLTVLGVVVPSVLAYGYHRVLAIPTLFATFALLRTHAGWVAALALALLVVLLFHLALYPWPNYHYGVP